MEPTTDPPAAPESESSPWRRRLIWIGAGLVALVVLVYGAIFFYTEVINDSPDALDEGDLAEALADTAPGSTEAVADASATEPPDTEPPDSGPPDTGPPDSGQPTNPATTVAPDAEPPTNPATSEGDGFDGAWIPTATSELGYRVEEVLAGVNTTAVGRSNEIEGELTIAGTQAEVDVSVLVETITSDDSRRDGQFRGRIMDTDNFPTATFRTTEPIELGSIPGPGEQVTATATGELTLKGTTNAVTFDVTAEAGDGRIGVLGSIPVLFEDYGIDNPSFGAVRTEDDGLVEFVLVFEPA